MKLCEEGNHLVPNLFWSKKKDRKSACMQCARKYATPISKSVKMIQSDVSSNKPVQAKKKVKQTNTPNKEKSLSELIKMADIVFSRWIKNRDIGTDNTFKCISCGIWKSKKEAQCGHYMPRTYSGLRFSEINNNAECEQCNCMDSNHLIGYRKNLIEKIGLASVEWLESHKIATTNKWTKEELYEIIKKYK